MRRLEGKTALVTGGGSGIGRAIAARLMSEGARVVVGDIDGDGARQTCAMRQHPGVECRAVELDVSDRASVQRAVDDMIDQLGRIDILVNNAGVIPMTPLLEISDEEWDRCLAVNLRGVFLCTQVVARAMLAGGGKPSGRIVNIGSTQSMVARPNLSPYAASKGGVLMLTRSSAVELGPLGITVNAVGPGTIDSGHGHWDDPAKRERQLSRIPLGRIGTPEDVAAAVAFLAGDDAAYINGAILFVDGGIHVQ